MFWTFSARVDSETFEFFKLIVISEDGHGRHRKYKNIERIVGLVSGQKKQQPKGIN